MGGGGVTQRALLPGDANPSDTTANLRFVKVFDVLVLSKNNF